MISTKAVAFRLFFVVTTMGSAAYLCKPMKPIVQISLDLTNIDEALETADGNLEASLRMICEAIHAQDAPAF